MHTYLVNLIDNKIHEAESMRKKYRFSWQLLDLLAILRYQKEEVLNNRYTIKKQRYKDFYTVTLFFDDGTSFNYDKEYICS